MIRLVLPLPPSDNASHVIVRPRPKTHPDRVKRVPSTDTADFKRTTGYLAKAWMRQAAWQMPPAKAPVIERVWIWWPDGRKHDPANIFKVLHDSLKGIVVPDDDQLWPQVWGVAIDRRDPRVEVAFERQAHDTRNH